MPILWTPRPRRRSQVLLSPTVTFGGSRVSQSRKDRAFSPISEPTSPADLVNQAIVSKAGTIMQNYVPESPPDPAYLFRLNNIVRPASNVFAFQKVGVGADVSGGGPWGFDVFYEKLDSSLEWDCEYR